jgi:hypothetical protein
MVTVTGYLSQNTYGVAKVDTLKKMGANCDFPQAPPVCFVVANINIPIPLL